MGPDARRPPAEHLALPEAADALAAQIRNAQYEMTFERARASNLVGTPFVALVCWVLWGAVDHRMLVGWLLLKAAISAWRLLVTRAFDRGGPAETAVWGRRFLWALAADGAVFGLLGTVLLPVQDPALAAIMIATLLGIASIGLVVLSMSFAASLALTVPAVLPATVLQLTRGDTLSVYIGVGMLVFLGLMAIEGRRASDHTRAMLRLRFQMDELATQRQQALDQAERSNAVKSQFLATMSHEMRTPLHGLLGMTRLLQHEVPQVSAAQQTDRLRIVERTGEHLLGIINDVLDHSRIESGHLRLLRQGFDLHELLASVIDLMRPAALDKGLALELLDRLPAACRLEGDPNRLRQVLLNLTGNAVKFTERGGVTLAARREADGTVVIEVSDTGPGVPAADRERIFDPFEQLDGSFSRRHGGTGLGLTISRDLVIAMGGALECLGTPGGGALFRLSVLLPDAPPTSAMGEAACAAAQAQTPLRGRVLLVEDNPVNALVAEASLRRMGLEVDRVEDGELAVSRATGAPYDLILMDCQMPGIDGFEATARIRRFERGTRRRPVPIVALTANAMAGDRERSLDAGMDDHLAKPFRDEDLSGVLRRHLVA
jgi:two-component system, sensor histidine kinase